jgi:hypothetical protein
MMKQTCPEVMVRTSSPWVSSGSLDLGGTIVFGPRARAGTRAFDILTAIGKGFVAVLATTCAARSSRAGSKAGFRGGAHLIGCSRTPGLAPR